ncbi:hypothetical protein EDD80_11281 [Anseongella ginsenosidimutans]|uniref:Uncharacterized protein n=1 Tax=Anseongella ginsenosidimutans TaxID=496056 RepID=A0A4R3KNV8_9SPHI|nr:hypothetical protein [Anseongella ginsenosidimutans]QEC52749.1 hypothetical protein FRZ59_10645 [Anseongella ginsenosidimutans]TCS85506.1 hypothetical protein EDD80_11281 [Anseongella ginsenosidimutans]
MNHLLKLAALLLIFTGTSCEEVNELRGKAPDDPEELKEYNQFKTTIEQGVSGTVLFQEGNCGFPLGDSCRTYPVSRNVRIYEYTTKSRTEGDGPFFTKVNTRLVTTARSDNEGFYQAKLAPGKYSLFIEEDSLLYANLYDKDRGILVAVVDSGWVTMLHPEITYKAVY